MNTNNIRTQMIVKEQKINILTIDNKEYISLTDLAKYADEDEPRLPIRDWMRNKEVISLFIEKLVALELDPTGELLRLSERNRFRYISELKSILSSIKTMEVFPLSINLSVSLRLFGSK